MAFLGPSLPAAQALRLVPGVELWPPICQGDLSSALERCGPEAILIVDGEFSQNLSVWHKEILHALALGVRMIGASSMGALRAAELDRFGMEGVGEIYAYYRDGWLTADADVAVLHADADDGYRALTWPLVNVRATVAKLREQGRLTGDEAAAILAAAERVHFAQRNRQTIERGLNGAIGRERAATLAALLADEYVDQKALDAIAGFEHLARLDQIPPPDGEEPLFRTGRGFEPLLWSDVELDRPNGRLRRYQLVADAALHHEDFDGLNERAANRYLVEMLAHEMGVEPTPAEIAEQRALTLSRLELTEDSLCHWLVANDTDEAHFDRLVVQQALNTRMRRWLVGTRLYERNRRLVIEQLQLEGGYVAAADSAARRRTLADHRPTPDYPLTDEAIVDLVVRQMAVSDWRVRGDIVEFADDQGFETVAGLLVALSDSATANAELQERRRRVAKALGIEGDSSAAASSQRKPPPAMTTHALLEAHQVTHVLLTAVELGVPGALADGARTTDEVALATQTDPARLERLLRALRAVRIVTREGDCWQLTPEGGALATPASGSGEPLACYGEHVRTAIFGHWAGLADVIRGAQPPGYPTDELSDRAIAAAWDALGLGETVTKAVDLPRNAHVADIGGGIGELALRLIDGRPDITVSLLERRATANRAAARFGDHPQVQVIALDGQPRLETPADRCLLTRVIMTLDDVAAVDVLRFAGRSLTADGRIEIFDLDDAGTPAAAFADLVNLARSGGGVRSVQQWDRLARAAGLEIVQRRSLAGPFVVVSMQQPQPAVGDEDAPHR